jgi:GntR family transcriptional regulator/MocR family aminotransferase
VLTLGEGDAPVFLRIARAVADDIRRGRLRTGEALPGTRSLAESLGVNRNTVVTA